MNLGRRLLQERKNVFLSSVISTKNKQTNKFSSCLLRLHISSYWQWGYFDQQHWLSLSPSRPGLVGTKGASTRTQERQNSALIPIRCSRVPELTSWGGTGSAGNAGSIWHRQMWAHYQQATTIAPTASPPPDMMSPKPGLDRKPNRCIYKIKASMSIFANADFVNHIQNMKNEEFQKEYSVAKERFIGRKHSFPSTSLQQKTVNRQSAKWKINCAGSERQFLFNT